MAGFIGKQENYNCYEILDKMLFKAGQGLSITSKYRRIQKKSWHLFHLKKEKKSPIWRPPDVLKLQFPEVLPLMVWPMLIWNSDLTSQPIWKVLVWERLK